MQSFDYAQGGVKECEKKKNKNSKKYRPIDWSFYPTLDEIYNWLDLIIRKWPNIVTSFNVGYSYEGRLIRGVRLSFKPEKQAIFIESNIHAREWITSAACTYLIFELLFSRDCEVRRMANRLDWWIVPVLNVDGFVYSHEKERLWRKSRRPISDCSCMGVDLNRNFEYLWGRIKHDPCSDQYGGTHPLSEPEVEQLTKFINSNIPEGSIKIYIALHSAAQAILLPWTHTRELPVDYDRLMYVAKAFADAVFSRFCTKYRYGTSANILKCKEYCGTSKDWAYAVKAIPIAFTIELPGGGRKAPFELPKGAILRVCLELLDGLVGMIDAIKTLEII